MTCRREDVKGAQEKKGTDDSEQLYGIKHGPKKDDIPRRRPPTNVKMKGIMVDGGATLHIIGDITKFVNFDNAFKPSSHCIELADRTRCTGQAQKRGTAVIYMRDTQDLHDLHEGHPRDSTQSRTQERSVRIHKTSSRCQRRRRLE